MINKARDYIYITTPYLILDQSMRDDLTSAAQSGVDVCIIVPRIYDKWYVYMVNVSISMNTSPVLSMPKM